MKIRLSKEPWFSGIRFVLQEGDHFSSKIIMKKMKEGEMIPETGHMKQEEAQLLMDELWHCGIRPSEGSGSAGSLKATQNHLEDMRRLVFKTDSEKGEA